jgi:purine nucleosidase
VHAGAAAPLERPLVTAAEVHGKSGLDGPDLPEPRMRPREGHAVDFLIDTLRSEPAGSVTLCTLGPLTNIALAFAKAPDIPSRVARIVGMGGGRSEGGNITPVAEFNIYADPHAAQAVFRAGVPVVLHPLDVTHRAVTSRDRVAAFRDLGTPAGAAVAAMLAFAQTYDMERYGAEGGPLHDPNVIAWLLAPELYRGRDVNLEVETASELTMGQTVVDWWGATDRPKNVHFIREVDDAAFFALLVERIGRL